MADQPALCAAVGASPAPARLKRQASAFSYEDSDGPLGCTTGKESGTRVQHCGVVQRVRDVREVGERHVEITVPPIADSAATLDAWYRELWQPLVRLAFLLTGSAAVAEDVVQEVFLRCTDRLAELDHPPSYLRAAVVNGCRSHDRTARRFSPAPDEGTGSPNTMPVELVELRDALGRLPARRRTALVLRYYTDLSFEDIGQLLNCREATVRSLVHRGVAQLREVLA